MNKFLLSALYTVFNDKGFDPADSEKMGDIAAEYLKLLEILPGGDGSDFDSEMGIDHVALLTDFEELYEEDYLEKAEENLYRISQRGLKYTAEIKKEIISRILADKLRPHSDNKDIRSVAAVSEVTRPSSSRVTTIKSHVASLGKIEIDWEEIDQFFDTVESIESMLEEKKLPSPESLNTIAIAFKDILQITDPSKAEEKEKDIIILVNRILNLAFEVYEDYDYIRNVLEIYRSIIKDSEHFPEFLIYINTLETYIDELKTLNEKLKM